MDKFTGMIVIVLAAIAVCMGVVIFDGTGFSDEDTYDIEYDLCGGSGINPNPSGYVAGTAVSLQPCAYEDGVELQAFFGGWYLDPGYEQLCMEITPEMSGDIKLYAKWQEDAVGRSITLTFNGLVKDGIFNSYSMTGQQVITYRFLAEDRSGYYMTYDTTTTYDHGLTQYTESQSTGSWNNSDGSEPQNLGRETINTLYGPKTCDVYGSGGTKQWIGIDDANIYRIESESVGFFSSSKVIYELTGSTIVPIVNEVDVIAYADEGITVSGYGTYGPTDVVTLTATSSADSEFAGWYDSDMRLVSSSPTVQLEMGWNDVEIYAMNVNNPDYLTETFTETVIDLDSDAITPSWHIYRYGTESLVAEGDGDTLRHTFQETGLYEIIITDGSSAYHGYRTLEIEGDVVRSYEWTFKGKDYSCQLTMDYSKVLEYRNKLPVSERCQIISYDNADRDHERSFVTYKDPYIQELASKLNVMSAGMNDVDRANFVLAFMQSIEYQSDEVYMNAEEYWKFPVETLYDMGGDCEDSSILYSAIVKAMGYDTALFILPGHMMSSISIDGKVVGDSEYCPEDGKRYYYVETTSDNAKIGQKSYGMDNPTIVVIY